MAKDDPAPSGLGGEIRASTRGTQCRKPDESKLSLDRPQTNAVGTEHVRRCYDVSRNAAAKLLEQSGYRRRALRKKRITGHVDAHEPE